MRDQRSEIVLREEREMKVTKEDGGKKKPVAETISDSDVDRMTKEQVDDLYSGKRFGREIKQENNFRYDDIPTMQADLKLGTLKKEKILEALDYIAKDRKLDRDFVQKIWRDEGGIDPIGAVAGGLKKIIETAINESQPESDLEIFQGEVQEALARKAIKESKSKTKAEKVVDRLEGAVEGFKSNLNKGEEMKVTKDDVKKAVKKSIKDEKVPDGWAVVDNGGGSRTVIDPNGKVWDVQGNKRIQVTAFVEKVVKTCEKCGKEFEPSKFTPYQKFCKDCKSNKEKKASVVVKRECKHCGNEFETDNPNKKYCGAVCRRKSVKDRVPTQDIEAKCSECGKTFMRSKYLPYITTCEDCRNKVRKANRVGLKAKTKPAAKVKSAPAKMETKQGTFEEWMTAVDDIIEASVGVVSADLPDADYQGSFEVGKPAEQMAEEVIADSEEG